MVRNSTKSYASILLLEVLELSPRTTRHVMRFLVSRPGGIEEVEDRDILSTLMDFIYELLKQLRNHYL